MSKQATGTKEKKPTQEELKNEQLRRNTNRRNEYHAKKRAKPCSNK